MSHDADTLPWLGWRSGLRGQARCRFDCFGLCWCADGGRLTATFAFGLAFLGDTRRRGALFGDFSLIVLVFLAAVTFLRVVALVTSVFLRPLRFAFLLVATTTSLNAHLYRKSSAGSLPNKTASQRTKRSSHRASTGAVISGVEGGAAVACRQARGRST